MGASYVLKVLAQAVAEMRDDQRVFFLSKSAGDLRKAKKSEIVVDRILKLINDGRVSFVDVDGNSFDVVFQGSDLWLIEGAVDA